MSELLALGVSHKTAPLDLRERLSLTEGRAVGALAELTAAEGIHEAAAISTCNRTELYLVVSDPVEAESTALGVLTRQAEIRPTELLGHLYSLRSGEAARHLFRVTAGLDSMIVGEAEIQGQVKRAYELALVEGATGPILNRLFRGALAAGGRIREETAIGEKGVSIPSVAVELARRTLGELSDRRVLVVGAGETAELVARALVARGVATVFVANRHYDRAIGLAQRFGGWAVRFEELPEQLQEADIVVTATNSPHHIVERDELEHVMQHRDGRPLLLVDIAVPRDVEPECREVPGVSLHDIDDVQQIVERNASGREAEAQRAEPIIGAELDRFERWLASLEVVPTIAALRERADEIVRRVLTENDGRWDGLSDSDRERLVSMAKAIASRLLHEPTLRMRRSAGGDEAYLYVSALRELFGLDAETEPQADAGASVTELHRRKADLTLRIATRGSALALAQATQVAEMLDGAELVPVSSDGEPGDKARFVRGVERALLDGEAEIGVHSAKDLPAGMPDGLAIAAVPAREDPSDVWIGPGSSLDDVPEGARVGTASLRRRAQLLAARPDLSVGELHGNVDTRLRKLADGELDAIVLAAAGLRRLGREGEASFTIPAEQMTPAAGQGALVLQARAGDDALCGRRLDRRRHGVGGADRGASRGRRARGHLRDADRRARQGRRPATDGRRLRRPPRRR